MNLKPTVLCKGPSLAASASSATGDERAQRARRDAGHDKTRALGMLPAHPLTHEPPSFYILSIVLYPRMTATRQIAWPVYLAAHGADRGRHPNSKLQVRARESDGGMPGSLPVRPGASRPVLDPKYIVPC